MTRRMLIIRRTQISYYVLPLFFLCLFASYVALCLWVSLWYANTYTHTEQNYIHTHLHTLTNVPLIRVINRIIYPK